MSNRKRTRKNSSADKPGYASLDRTDLSGFDAQATDLILEAMEAGCTGRISAKGHAILRNNIGDTASVSRHSAVQNRSAANTRSNVKRLIRMQPSSAFGDLTPASDPAPEPERITLDKAFSEYGKDFDRWFTAKKNGIPAGSQIDVAFDNHNNPKFSLVTTGTDPSGTHEEVDMTSTQPMYSCPECNASFRNINARNGHTAVHRKNQPETQFVSMVAKQHKISEGTVHNRMKEAGITALTPENVDQLDFTKRRAGRPMKNPVPALHAVPDLDPDEKSTRTHNTVTSTGTPTPGTAPSRPSPEHDDAETTLRRLRQVLGEDPRITELTARNDELEKKLATETARADDAETKLSLIQEAIGA